MVGICEIKSGGFFCSTSQLPLAKCFPGENFPLYGIIILPKKSLLVDIHFTLNVRAWLLTGGTVMLHNAKHIQLEVFREDIPRAA